jgi:hypothetical protein
MNDTTTPPPRTRGSKTPTTGRPVPTETATDIPLRLRFIRHSYFVRRVPPKAFAKTLSIPLADVYAALVIPGGETEPSTRSMR